MKLIVCGLEALSGYVSREFYYVITELITAYGWKQIEPQALWTGRGTVKRTLLNRFGELPEVILFWESYDFLNAYAADVSRLQCLKLIMTDDLHCQDKQAKRKQLLAFALCEVVLATYGYAWQRFCPEFSLKKIIWIPHSASPDFMLGYNHCPANAILLSGAINRYYPLRLQMEALRSRCPESIAYHPHPGYGRYYEYQEQGAVGHGYALEINKYRAGFTDSLIFKYVVAKYFEIPATGALLLADDSVSGSLSRLGFVEHQHYVPVSSKNLEETIRYVLDERNHGEVDQIRKRGQELVWERHKTSDRARQINDASRGIGG